MIEFSNTKVDLISCRAKGSGMSQAKNVNVSD